VNVGMASKCPQMNTVKVLVQKFSVVSVLHMAKFGGVERCSWIAWWGVL